MLKNIIFDCGGVLTNCVPKEYVHSLGLSKEDEDKLFNAIYHSKVWEKSDLGMYKDVQAMIDDFIDENKSIEPLVRIFFKPDWMSFYYPYEEGQQLLIDLKNQGYNIYILSNYAKEGFMYCYDHYDCFKYVDGMVVSADVHLIKPDPRIYEYIIDKYHLNKKECLFIDDREVNVNAAIKCGINSIVYKRNPEEIKKVIKSL